MVDEVSSNKTANWDAPIIAKRLSGSLIEAKTQGVFDQTKKEPGESKSLTELVAVHKKSGDSEGEFYWVRVDQLGQLGITPQEVESIKQSSETEDEVATKVEKLVMQKEIEKATNDQDEEKLLSLFQEAEASGFNVDELCATIDSPWLSERSSIYTACQETKDVMAAFKIMLELKHAQEQGDILGFKAAVEACYEHNLDPITLYNKLEKNTFSPLVLSSVARHVFGKDTLDAKEVMQFVTKLPDAFDYIEKHIRDNPESRERILDNLEKIFYEEKRDSALVRLFLIEESLGLQPFEHFCSHIEFDEAMARMPRALFIAALLEKNDEKVQLFLDNPPKGPPYKIVVEGPLLKGKQEMISYFYAQETEHEKKVLVAMLKDKGREAFLEHAEEMFTNRGFLYDQIVSSALEMSIEEGSCTPEDALTYRLALAVKVKNYSNFFSLCSSAQDELKLLQNLKGLLSEEEFDSLVIAIDANHNLKLAKALLVLDPEIDMGIQPFLQLVQEFENASILEIETVFLQRAVENASYASLRSFYHAYKNGDRGIKPEEFFETLLREHPELKDKNLYLFLEKLTLEMQKHEKMPLPFFERLFISAFALERLSFPVTYTAKRESGLKRATIVGDHKVTVLLKKHGDFQASGGMKRVYGAVEVAMQQAAAPRGSYLAACVNKKGQAMSPRELEYERKYGNLRSVSVHPSRKTGEEKTIYTMEKYDSDLFRYSYYEKMPTGQIISLFSQEYTHTLVRMHKNNEVHRDIKLLNALLRINPDQTVSCRLADFGLSYNIETDYARAYESYGTPDYAAPDAVTHPREGESDPKQEDMFAVGCMLFELLEKRPIPWGSEMRSCFVDDDNSWRADFDFENHGKKAIDQYHSTIEEMKKKIDAMPDGAEKRLYEIALSLLHEDPSQRMNVEEFHMRMLIEKVQAGVQASEIETLAKAIMDAMEYDGLDDLKQQLFEQVEKYPELSKACIRDELTV